MEGDIVKGKAIKNETRMFLFRSDTNTCLKTTFNEVISIYRSEESNRRGRRKRHMGRGRRSGERGMYPIMTSLETCMYF